MHGGNRVDNVQLCAVCHNPRNTDLAMRPADPDGTVNGINTAATDGIEQRQIDVKYLIHAIHGAGMRQEDFTVYGFGNSFHDFADVRFPGELNQCEICHRSGTYELPLADNVLGTTVNTQATVNTASPFGTSDFIPLAAAQDHTDDDVISPTAAACSACHDDTLTKTHMTQNGGSFATLQQFLDDGTVTETCAVCHGPGAIADVKVMHGIKE
jgi:OmcA/MtrC family decaheme c-type cytochrome